MFTTKKLKITTKTFRKYHEPLSVLSACLLVLMGAALRQYPEWVRVYAAPVSPDGGERYVEVVKEIPVGCKTEKCQILSYIVTKFGDDAANAITMIRQCENSTFDPTRKSGLNIQKSGRRSYDIGVMQINVDELDIEEQIKLTDYKYNVDRGYEKYKAAGNKFTPWSCSYTIGQTNYYGRSK